MRELFHLFLFLSASPEKRFRFLNIEIIVHEPAHHKKFYGGKSGEIPLSGISLIKKWEGFTAKAEPDALSGEPITIGWGATMRKNGSKWHLGDTITRKEADDLLFYQLENTYLPRLKAIPAWNSLNPHQQGAIMSFAYNLGEGFYGGRGFKQISNCLKRRDWKNIEKTLILYRNPGSRVERGLKSRRENEAEIFRAEH